MSVFLRDRKNKGFAGGGGGGPHTYFREILAWKNRMRLSESSINSQAKKRVLVYHI